ncbi:MAG: insulinase family protein [Myxococcales bacterium]|nr:insulinase family protein [Myxococcales bacterium]
MEELVPHVVTVGDGLRVVITEQPALHRVAIGLFVGVGSRHESIDDNGITHFLEHMLYRGTARYPSAHLQNRAFEELGGDFGAATHGDHTHLTVGVPEASLGPTLELLADLCTVPRLGEIETERGIVREEIREHLDEEGRLIDADDVIRQCMFGDHPLGMPITGPLAALDHFDEPSLRAHLARHYVAGNVVLSIAGRCKASAVERLAARTLGRLPRGRGVTPIPYMENSHARFRRHVASPGSQTELRISYRTPGERDPIAPALELLLRVIDDGMSTRLYHKLVDEGGLVYSCSAGWEPFHDVGALDISADVQPARLAAVVRAIFAMIDELCAKGPTKAEVEKARMRHRWAVEASLDSVEALEVIMGGAVMFDRPRSIRAQAARFDGIDGKQLRAVARQVFDPANLHVASIGTMTNDARDVIRAVRAK